MIEQPLNSLFFHMGFVSDSIYKCEAGRTITNLGAFGSSTLKPLELWGTLQFLSKIVRRRPEAYRKLGKRRDNLTVRTVKRTGATRTRGWGSDKLWITGKPTQKASQTYPDEFTRSIASLAWGNLTPSSRGEACD